MKINNQEEAINQIVKEYNFWGTMEDYPPRQPIHNAFFTGEPTIVSEEVIEGRKVWQYYWPEEKEQVLWLLDDGQRITSQEDVRPTIETQKNTPDFVLE